MTEWTDLASLMNPEMVRIFLHTAQLEHERDQAAIATLREQVERLKTQLAAKEKKAGK